MAAVKVPGPKLALLVTRMLGFSRLSRASRNSFWRRDLRVLEV
jgi:hypothetical protein